MRLLVIDEAAKVPAALYMSVRPMLAVSGGRLALLSTPFGTRGFFFDSYRQRDEWRYYEVPATACPRISPAFLAEERRHLGDWWFTQEYMCHFADADTAAFRREDVDAEGVGMPVVDMVRAALEAKKLDEIRVMACFFTHGDRLTQESRELRVGKAYLVSTLQALLQSGRIKWKRTPETEYLAEELLDYEIHVDQDANDKYGAFRVGTHDDVVTAVGLTAIDDGLDRDVAFSSAGSMVSRTIVEDLAWRAGQVRAQAAAGASGTATPDDDEDEWDPEREAASLEHQARLARMLHGLGDIRFR